MAGEFYQARVYVTSTVASQHIATAWDVYHHIMHRSYIHARSLDQSTLNFNYLFGGLELNIAFGKLIDGPGVALYSYRNRGLYQERYLCVHVCEY